MAGWKTQDMLDGLPPILNLAAAAGEDLGTTSDIVTDALTAFNLKASDAGHFSDILASASSNANTNVSLMGESFKYAAPIFGSVGYSAEDAALSIGLMANSGIKGTQAGTSLRSIITRLVKPTKESSQAMERLGLSITDSNGKMKPFNVLIEDMRRGFAKLNPEQKASVAAQLAGQEAMSGLLSIVNASPADYDKLKGAINNCDGATERMAKTMQDNAKGSVIEMKSALEGASIKIFQAVAPSITSLANSVSNLANKFSNLSPQTQEFLVKMGLVGIALGPVIGTFGRTITLVGKVGEAMLSLGGTLTGTTTAITGVGTAATGAGTAATGAGAAAGTGAVGFGALATAALPIVGIMAAVAGGVYLVGKNTETMNTNCLKSKEELGKLGSVLKDFNGGISISTNQMDNLNIKHKDWSKNVSPETQKALTEVSDKIQSLNLEIQNTNGLDGIITKPQIDSLIKRTDELFKGIQDRINAKVPEAQKKLADVFKADDGKIDKNEQAILDQLNKSHNKNIKELNKYEREIKQIYQRALNEKRDLKKEEMDKIQELTNKAGQIELKATVKNKKELEETKDQFNKRMQHADMEAISKALKEKVKASGEQIKIEKKKYNDQIKVLEENIPKLTGKEREYAEQSLKKLKEDKEKSVRTQQEKYQGYLQEAMKQYPELINFIDTSNGEILNNQQQSDKKKLNEYMKNMEGMAGITKTGYYEIKDTVKNEMHGCYVEVDEKSGEIVGVWDNTTHDVYGNPIKPQSDIAKDLLTGERFQPIKAGYDKKKEAIKKNALEVACNKNYNLFDWVPTLWEGVKSSLSPISVGTGGSIINSAFHYNGLDNVPYDGYIARLHKDERVLTAEENKVYSNNKMGNSEINIIFNEKVDSPAETARRIQNSLREIGFSF